MGNYFTITDQKVMAAEIAMRIYATLNIFLEKKQKILQI